MERAALYGNAAAEVIVPFSVGERCPRMHVARAFDIERSDKEVKQLAAEQGVSLDMLSDYCVHPSAKSSHCVVVNFASIPTDHIAVAIELLETIFQREILAHQR